jgi:rhodanese-related sulfurtransferase
MRKLYGYDRINWKPLKNITRLSIGLIATFTLAPLASWAGHGIEDLVNSVAAERVRQLMDAGEKLTLIDLRPVRDFQEKRLPGARSFPLSEFTIRANEIPKSGRVVLYCDCLLYQLVESAKLLETRGHRNVSVMLEGFSGWRRLGYPVESGL